MAGLVDIKGRNVDIGSTIQFVNRYGRDINSSMTGRNAKVLGLSPKGRVQLSFCKDSSSTFTVKPERIADCAVLVQIESLPNQLPSMLAKEPIESDKIQMIEWAIKTIDEIGNLSVDDDVKEQLTNKVLEAVGIEKTKTRKHTPGKP